MKESAYHLEVKAAEERRRLHSSVSELKSFLSEAVDLKRNVRAHLGVVCGVAVLLGITSGYSFAAMFTGHGRRVLWPY
jgi:hypothetical protein